MSEKIVSKAKVLQNGPLSISGPVEITLADGSVKEMKAANICRCGESKNKPFCDGSHREAEFKG